MAHSPDGLGGHGDADLTAVYPGVSWNLFSSVLRLVDISNAYSSTCPWEPPPPLWALPNWRTRTRFNARKRWKWVGISPPDQLPSGPGNPYPTPPPEPTPQPDSPGPANGEAELTSVWTPCLRISPGDVLHPDTRKTKVKTPLRSVFKAGSFRSTRSDPAPLPHPSGLLRASRGGKRLRIPESVAVDALLSKTWTLLNPCNCIPGRGLRCSKR